MSEVGGLLGGVMGTWRSGRGDTVVQAMVKSAARTMGSTVGRQIVRGVLGSLLGGKATMKLMNGFLGANVATAEC